MRSLEDLMGTLGALDIKALAFDKKSRLTKKVKKIVKNIKKMDRSEEHTSELQSR